MRTKTLIASVVVLVLGPEAHAQTIGVQSVTTSTATSGKGSISSSIASGYYAGIASTGLASGTNGGGESAVWQGYWQFTFQLSGYAGSPASAPSVNCPGYTRFEGTSASTSAGGAPGFGSSSASAWADCGSYATNSYPPVQPQASGPNHDYDIDSTPFAVTMNWVPSSSSGYWLGTVVIVSGSLAKMQAFASGIPEGAKGTGSNSLGTLSVSFQVGTTTFNATFPNT